MLSHELNRISLFRIACVLGAALMIAWQSHAVVANHPDDAEALQMVYVHVSIAVSGDKTNTAILDQLQLITVAGSKAEIQLGQQVAVPTGVTSLPANRGSSRSYSQQQVGTVVQIQPQLIGKQIVVELQLEKSWIEAPMSDSVLDLASRYTTFSTQCNSTLVLSDGKSEVLKARVSGVPGGQREAVITVTGSLKPVPSEHVAIGKPVPSKVIKRSNQKPPVQSSHQEAAMKQAIERAKAGDDKKVESEKANQKAPVTSQTSGIRRIFELIDKNKDGMISSAEWKMHRLARSLESRGVKYSEGMDPQQFEQAVSGMKKQFLEDERKEQ